MIYITGDTHGEVSRFEEIHEQYRLSEGDMLIVAGDFGCIFGLGWRDEHKLDTLARLPYDILFIDGNHECFPQMLQYKKKQQDFSHCIIVLALCLDFCSVVEPNNRPLVVVYRDAFHQNAEGYGIEFLCVLRQTA